MPDFTPQAQIEPSELPGRAFPRLPDELPSGTPALGRDIEGAADVLQHHAQVAEQLAQRTMAGDAENKLQAVSLDLTHNPQTGALTKQGQNAFGLTSQYLPQYDTAAQQIVDSVPDARARLAVQQSAAHMRGALAEQLDSHELQQHQVFATQTAQDSVKLAEQASAANYNNPTILQANHDRIGDAIDSMGQTQGWSADMTSQAKQEAYSRLHGDVVDRMLTDDKPQIAQAYLSAHKDEMDATSAYSAERAIDAHLKEKQNEQKQDISDRYQDSLQSSEYGLKNPISVSRPEMDVLYPHDAQRRWDELQIIARAGAQAKAYDQMTPDQIRADVKSSAPKEGGPEALYQLKAQEILTRAATRSLEQRSEDPAAFVQARGNWNAIDLRNPQAALSELQSRSRTQDQVSQQIGVPVPLLSKPEAAQFTQAMTQSTPRQQASILSQLQSVLPGDKAYQSVLSQIAPHSPVIALAGQLTNPPAKGNHPAWYDSRFATDPQVPEQILGGEAILSGKGEDRANGGFNMPKDTDLSNEFWNAAGGKDSNLFQGRQSTSEMYYDAYKNTYASLAAQKGVNSGVIDPKLAQQAAESILGDHVQFNHTDLVVPRGMDPSRFESIASQAVSETAKAAGYTDADVKAMSDMGLRELGGNLGTGRYAIIDGNGRPLKGPDGKQTLIVDIKGVKPAAQRSDAEIRQSVAAHRAERGMSPSGEQAGTEQDFLDGPGFTASDIKPAGVFTGLNPLTPLRGIASGAMEAGRVLVHGLPSIARAMSQGDQGDISATLEQQADAQRDPTVKPPWEQPLTEWSSKMSDEARAGAKAVTPDPRTTGSAANLVFGASKVLTEGGLSLAATAGNIPAAAASMGYISGMARYRDLKDQGVDDDTAEKLATTEGILQGAGMVAPMGLPAKWIEAMTPVRQALTQLATGAAANAGQGVASRYITHQILTDAGYTQLADQSKTLDGEAIASDLISGAFFGGAHYAGQRPELAQRARELADSGQIDAQVRDAAKVVQTERMAAVDRAPGVPVDPQSQAKHQAALEKSISDLLENKPVDIEDEAAGATFARPAESDRPDLRQMMVNEFKNAGVADEAAKLDDLQALMEHKFGDKSVKPQERPLEVPISEAALTDGEGGGYHVAEEPLTDEQAKTFQGLRSHLPADEELDAAGEGEPGQPGAEDAGGQGERPGPLRVYRGADRALTPEDFEESSLGKSSGHPSSGLGVFFSNDQDDAAHYGPNVTAHHLDIHNPKVIPADELPGFDSPEEATAYRDQLRSQGHDGMVIDGSHLGGPVNYVAFDHAQVRRPQTEPAQMALDRAKNEAKSASDDAKLFTAAADCASKTR